MGKMSAVLSDRKAKKMTKGHFFKSVMRPAMTYSNETCPMKKAVKKKLNVTEMWMMGKIRSDRM